MKRLDTCPDGDRIAIVLGGGASDEELDALAAHIDGCDACRRCAETLTGDASLEDDLNWATRVRARTSVSVDESLSRLNACLPDYELIAEIGRGGMGIVYKANQPKLNRQVAIKVLPALLGVVRPDAKARFRREAELAAGLDHTNIISIHDYGEADGTLFYAMQLIRGRSLGDVLAEIERVGAAGCIIGDPCEPGDAERVSRSPSGTPGAGKVYYRRVAQWMAEVADALHYAHEHGVIHRDIKPSNLLLTEDGKLMISDFGLARPTDAHTLTRSRALLGTCRYMAPEQLDPVSPEADSLSDIYALGATLYEMLAFRPMFPGPDDRQVMHQITSREPPAPHRLVGTVPEKLETICLKAVRKERDDRYQSAAAFADDLRRWLLDLPIEARRGSVASRGLLVVRRHPVASALAMTAVLLAITSSLFWSMYAGASRETTQARQGESRQRALALVQQAQTHLDDERYAEAIESLDRSLERDLVEGEGLRLKAVVLTRTGRTEEARAVLERWIGSHPDDWRARYLLAMLSHFEQAWETASMGLAREREDDGAAMRRSVALGAQLAHVERLSPGSPEALCLRACVEPSHRRAIELLDDAIALDPGFTDALLEKAARLGCLGNFVGALTLAERVIEARHGGSRAHGMRALALAGLGQWGPAEVAFTDALACDPTNIDWWYDRAIARTYLGRLRGAIEDATKAIELDPGYAYAYVARGIGHSGLGAYPSALADFDRAEELDPTNADVYAERGLVHWMSGQYDRSLADANRLVQLEPRRTRGYQRRAQTYLRLERWEDALSDLDRCDEINPQDFATPTVRGGVYFSSGRYDQAAAAFEAGEAIRPTAYGNYHFHALCMIRLGRFQAAIAPLTSWISLADQTDLGLMRRGMVYEALGEHELAIADYELAAQSGRLGGYPDLWAGINLALRGDRASASERFSACEQMISADTWMHAVLETVSRRLSPDALVEMAATPMQRTEALYYAGVARLLSGETDAAVAAFVRCYQAGSADTYETDFANIRARALSKD